MATPARLAGRPKAQIILEIIGDRDNAAGWCIVRLGSCVDSGAVEDGGVTEAAVEAVKTLLALSAFEGAATYVSHRQCRALLHRIYPNVILNPADAVVPSGDLKLARDRAEEEFQRASGRHLSAKERRKVKRKDECKRRKYVENLLLPRLATTVQVVHDEDEAVAGIAWLAEDGRHAVHAVEADHRLTAEMIALRQLLSAFNKGRRLLVTMPSRESVALFEHRAEWVAGQKVIRGPLLGAVGKAAQVAEERDIIAAAATGGPLEQTCQALAQFALDMHRSGGESPEQWEEIDRILLEGIGFDRARERRSAPEKDA